MESKPQRGDLRLSGPREDSRLRKKVVRSSSDLFGSRFAWRLLIRRVLSVGNAISDENSPRYVVGSNTINGAIPAPAPAKRFR